MNGFKPLQCCQEQGRSISRSRRQNGPANSSPSQSDRPHNAIEQTRHIPHAPLPAAPRPDPLRSKLRLHHAKRCARPLGCPRASVPDPLRTDPHSRQQVLAGPDQPCLRCPHEAFCTVLTVRFTPLSFAASSASFRLAGVGAPRWPMIWRCAVTSRSMAISACGVRVRLYRHLHLTHGLRTTGEDPALRDVVLGYAAIVDHMNLTRSLPDLACSAKAECAA